MDSSPQKHDNSSSSKANRKEGLRFSEFWYIFKLKRKYPIIFVVLTVLGTLVGRLMYIPVYTANSSLVLLEQQGNQLAKIAGADIFGGSNNGDGDLEQLLKYVAYLRSGQFYLSLAETLKFKPEYQKLNLTRPKELTLKNPKFWDHFFATTFGDKKSRDFHEESVDSVLIPVEQLAGMLASLAKIDHDGAKRISISVTTLDPYTSMVIANTAAEVFNTMMKEHDQNEITEIQKFVDERLRDTAEKLKRDELELVNYKQKNNILSNGDSNVQASRLTGIDNELNGTRLRYQENERLIKYYEDKLADRQKAIVDGGTVVIKPEQDTGNLQQSLENLRRQKFLMTSQGYAEDHWRVQEVDKEIRRLTEAFKEQIRTGKPQVAQDDVVNMDSSEIQTKIDQLRHDNELLNNKIGAVNKVREDLTRQLASLPEEEQKLVNLSNNVKLSFELYSNLKKRLQEIEIQRVALKARIKIDALSKLPGAAPRPSMLAQLMFAIIAGLFFGCVIVILLELLDTTVKHRSDLEDCELLALGNIPHIESKMASALGLDGFRPDMLICETQPESAEAMAFKYVRAQLNTMRGADGKLAQTITVTSPDRADGKSFIAANLAVCIAQMEKKVVLLDCDFRNPSVHKYLGYENNEGLTSLLTMNTTLSEIVLSSKVPNLDILPAGFPNPNPTELISNDKFRVLIKYLKSKYEYVIMDAPPATFVVDAPVMASVSDGVILVASYRKTRKDALLMAHKKILQISHKRVHAVLTNVKDVHEFNSYYVTPYALQAGKKMPYGPNTGLANGQDSASKAELQKFEEHLKKKSA